MWQPVHSTLRGCKGTFSVGQCAPLLRTRSQLLPPQSSAWTRCEISEAHSTLHELCCCAAQPGMKHSIHRRCTVNLRSLETPNNLTSHVLGDFCPNVRAGILSSLASVFVSLDKSMAATMHLLQFVLKNVWQGQLNCYKSPREDTQALVCK
jgi:hypothetical protein